MMVCVSIKNSFMCKVPGLGDYWGITIMMSGS